MRSSKGEIYPLTSVKHDNLPLANLLLKGLKPPQPQPTVISQKNEGIELVIAVLIVYETGLMQRALQQ